MKLLNASPRAVEGLDELPAKVNYFIGNDPSKWRTNISTYGKVRYRDVYPGVDLVYYGNQRQLEYDLVVAPGADSKRIRISFSGVRGLRLDAQGNLILVMSDGELEQHKPIVYQQAAGARKEVRGEYVIKSKHEVGFK